MNLMNKDRVILGVDPGTTIMGYGIISTKGKNINLLSMGVVKLSKYDSHYRRLAIIFEKVSILIDQYHPAELAIEAPFFGKNVQSMLKLGRAQGMAIAAAMQKDIPVFEYAPKKIKMAVTGNGNASKEQVAGMLSHLVPYDRNPSYMDATDGLAAAICHFLQSGQNIKKNSNHNKDWGSFLKENPDRIT